MFSGTQALESVYKSVILKSCTCSMSFFLLISLSQSVMGQSQVSIVEVNPDRSTWDANDPDAASGGRVHNLGSVPGDANTYYAASEWGGLFKTTDGGQRWFRLDRHVPVAMWDVKIDPFNTNRVVATSMYDGKKTSLAGINVSINGGASWTHPATATPPTGFCLTNDAGTDVRRAEPAAFGISFDPSNSGNIFVGTNCGLAVSADSGLTWNFIDPTLPDPADNIWDVVVHNNGIIDLCGDDGHQRSIDGGVTWTTAAGVGLTSGMCSIAVSPQESNVLFVTVGQNIFESSDGGNTWTTIGTPDSLRQGRVPFVATNPRSATAFDLWFGDVRLYRGICTSNPTGGGQRCPLATVGAPQPAPPAGWNGPFTRSVGGHDDVGDIVFDTTAAVNTACPILLASDGGVYINTNGTDPGCHTPAWEQPTQTIHALWLWDLTGADQGSLQGEDVYFGTQDNGPFATTDAGAQNPVWSSPGCCDGFDTAADSSRVLYSICCTNGVSRFSRSNPGMVGGGVLNQNSYPADGLLPTFKFTSSFAEFGGGQYAMITQDCTTLPDGVDNNGDGNVDEFAETLGCSGVNGGDGGLHFTANAGASPIVWTELGPASEPETGDFNAMCGVKVAVGNAGTPTFYVQVGRCQGATQDQLWTFTGTNAANNWAQINPPGGTGGFGIFAVDPGNPNRIVASHLRSAPDGIQMVMSIDGGNTWVNLATLDNLMTGGGVFQYQTQSGPGPASSYTRGGYPQPTLVAFHPSDNNIMIAGAADSGVFTSMDGGANWRLITDPISSRVPRPRFAHFDTNKNITSRDNQQWHQDVAGIVGKADKNDHFGAAVAAGDFNGDGFTDLAIGIPDEGFEGTDEGDIKQVGAVSVLYGSSNGISAGGNQQWHQDVAGIVGKADKNDHFGAAVAAGDFNGDGFTDLAIGIPDEGFEGTDEGDIKQVGAVSVLYGSSNGISAGGNQQWHQDVAGIVGKADKNDHFGAAVAAGDFNGDGFTDLAIGIPDEGFEGTDEGDIKQVGAVSVLYGSSNGISAGGNQQWHQDVAGIVGKADKNDHFGAAVAAGDFNGDGFTDLAIGIPDEGFEGTDEGDIKQVGAVSVLYGSSNGISAGGNQQWHQDVAGIVGKADKNDHFGAAVAAGDFNGDGFTDLAIGIPDEGFEGTDEGDIKQVGAVSVLYGSSNGISAGGNQQWHQDVAGIVGKADKNDHFGAAVAAGDFNGDGFTDLAIGIPDEGFEGTDEGDIKQVGAVSVLYGSSNGISAGGNQQWHQDVAGIVGKADKNDHFGAAVAAGDFNGDGFTDLAIGIPDEGFEGTDEGDIKQVGAVTNLFGSKELVDIYVGTQGRGVWRISLKALGDRSNISGK